jgi:DNA polymerase
MNNELQKLHQQIRECTSCPFDASKEVRYCGGVGSDPRVLFVAESPSTKGGIGKRPAEDNFIPTYKADILFKKMKTEFGLDDCYSTDLVKCGVPSGKPTIQKLNNCVHFLKEEIRILRPKVIVAVGKTFAVQENGKVKPARLFDTLLQELLNPEFSDIPILVTWHYSYVWRRCKVKSSERTDRSIPEIKPEKMEIWEKQYRKILEYL